MSQPAFVNDARVMAKGQVTIPKNVRAALGVDTGDRVTFIVDGNNVRVVNSTVYALMRFQEQMKGEAEKAGIGLNEALSMACARGWQSFKAEWVQNTRSESFNAPAIEPRPKSIEPDWSQLDYGISRPLSEC